MVFFGFFGYQLYWYTARYRARRGIYYAQPTSTNVALGYVLFSFAGVALAILLLLAAVSVVGELEVWDVLPSLGAIYFWGMFIKERMHLQSKGE